MRNYTVRMVSGVPGLREVIESGIDVFTTWLQGGVLVSFRYVRDLLASGCNPVRGSTIPGPPCFHWTGLGIPWGGCCGVFLREVGSRFKLSFSSMLPVHVDLFLYYMRERNNRLFLRKYQHERTSIFSSSSGNERGWERISEWRESGEREDLQGKFRWKGPRQRGFSGERREACRKGPMVSGPAGTDDIPVGKNGDPLRSVGKGHRSGLSRDRGHPPARENGASLPHSE